MRKYVLALTASLTPALLSVQAYASTIPDREDQGSFNSPMRPLISGLNNLVGVMGKVWDVMISNPLFLVFLGAGLFSMGVWIFRKVKGAAKR